MSAELLEREQAKLPVWVVHGINWHLDVPLDEFNAEFDAETQVYEAASIALMVFKGEDRGIFIVMDTDEEVPLLGPTMVVHLKGTDPNKGYFPFTHIVLANQGFYKESVNMEAILSKELEAIQQDQIANEVAQKALAEEAKKRKIKPPKN